MKHCRYVRILLIGLVAWTCGCLGLRHVDAKAEAHDRWNGMRSGVKLNLAEQQYSAGQFEDAVRTISEALRLDTRNADAYVLLVQANLELGRASSAQAALDAAVAADVSSPELAYMTGVVLELRGDVHAALERYRAARSQDPGQSDYLVAEAECLVALGKPSEALRLLEAQGDRLDDDGTVPALTGHIAAMVGDLPSATRGYRAALSARTALNGVPASPTGRHEAARAHGELSGATVNPVVAPEFARLLARSGRFVEALEVLEPLLRTTTVEGEGDLRRTAALCHLGLGDALAAIEVLRAYASTHVEDTLAQLLLAKAAIANNNLDFAEKCIEAVEQRQPDRIELWLVRATLNWRRGKLGKAAADLADVLQNAPDDIEAHCLLAEVFHEQKRMEAARTHFQQALRIDPDCAWAAAGLRRLKRAHLPLRKEPTPKLTSASADHT